MDGSRDCRLTISHVATHMKERGDHDFCHSRSHNTDTDPTSREQPATAELYLGPHPRKSHALSTELPPPPAEFLETPKKKKWCGGTRLPTQQSIVNHDDGSATKKKIHTKLESLFGILTSVHNFGNFFPSHFNK